MTSSPPLQMNIMTAVPINRRGLMLVLSSPSGAGKSTLTRLLRDDPEMALTLSVSVTTRKRRSSEVDGIHYHFISTSEFESRRERGELVEWAKVHGNYYGTLRASVENALTKGQDMLFDIDYQGAAQLQEKMGQDVVSVFILPPSMKELMARLNRRAEDSHETIALRLDNARQEMRAWPSYDYILLNEDLDKSYAALKAIIVAERLTRKRQVNLADFIGQLIEEAI